MANPVQIANRADMDIREDILDLFINYGPMMHDRHRVHVDVKDGAVTVSGHVKSAITRKFLVNSVPAVRGVKSLDASLLYSDEAIRREVGHITPYGVFVNVEYGAVILSGKLPDDADIEEIVKQIATVAGVNRVLTSFTS